MYVHNGARTVNLIVPEMDLFRLEDEVLAACLGLGDDLIPHLRPDRVEPLKRLALAIWEQGLATMIETYDECGPRLGQRPSLLPFAIVDGVRFPMPDLESPDVGLSRLRGGGVLIEDRRGVLRPGPGDHYGKDLA